MPEDHRAQIGWSLGAIVAYGGAVAVMYGLWAEFHAIYFWTSTAIAVAALAAGLVLFRPRATDSETDWVDEPETSRPRKHLEVESTEYYSREFDSPREPIHEAPTGAEADVTQPEAFEHRGFTLFERTSRAKGAKARTTYVFSKKQIPGGRAVAFPEGYEVRWDSKKRKPVLERLHESAVAAPREVDVASGKLCAAVLGPGEFCRKPAMAGKRFCGTHKNGAKRRAEALVVRKDQATAQPSRRGVRGGRKPVVEVVTARAPVWEGKAAAKRAKKKKGRSKRAGRTRTTGSSFEVVVARRAPDEGKASRKGRSTPNRKRQGTQEVEVRMAKGSAAPRSTKKARSSKKGRARGRKRTGTVEVNTPRGQPNGVKTSRSRLVVQDDSAASRRKMRKLRVQTGEVDVLVPRDGLGVPDARPRKPARCRARTQAGKLCTNRAKGKSPFCAQHADYRPRTKVEARRDSKALSTVGLKA